MQCMFWSQMQSEEVLWSDICTLESCGRLVFAVTHRGDLARLLIAFDVKESVHEELK